MNEKGAAHILLVDDEEAITAQLAPFLERAGFAVTVASDGAEALRLVDELAVDLIVLDVLMPQLDGREMLRRLRQASNWTPVILLTKIGSPGERAMARSPGEPILVRRITGVQLLACRRRRSISRPSSCGIRTSRTMRSTANSSTSRSASAPSLATVTANPARSRKGANCAVIASSSSTNRMCAAPFSFTCSSS